jgi:hypothetical protein
MGIYFKKALVLVILLVVGGCATSGQRSTALTNRLQQQTNLAANKVDEALDAKDQINKLIKENEYYDSKEIKLLNNTP